MKKLILILMCSLVSCGDVATASERPHEHHETTVNNYSIGSFTGCNGQAALGAMNQIHPSANISGLQLGGGIALKSHCFGRAIGAAYNIKGLGVFNSSMATEGDEVIWGAGFNFSLKP